MAQPSVTLKQGTFLGTELSRGGLPKAIEQFLGIPYGLSTGGERRFRPPLKVTPSTETFDASKYGQRCPSDTPDAVPMGEDCLNANVFRPKERDVTQKLPVVVHFHGGSFNFGSAQTRNIESLVAWSSEPMLGITFNYRLGAFGFLPIEGALNLGLLDQILLLQWVQENITEFGGDPNNVTIMGVSAGAHSIGHHLMNPTKACLFHKAILESGAPTARLTYPYNHPLHQRQLQTFLEHAGCASVSSSQLLTTLRSLSVATIESASVLTFMDYNQSVLWPFQPVIDNSPGSIIPISPIKRWLQGNHQKVPILTGFNTNEGAVFVPETVSSSSEFTNFFHTLLPDLTPSDLLSLNKTYPDPTTNPSSPFKETRPGLGAQFKRLEQAYGHFAYVAPVRQTANFLSEDDTNSAPVYLYHFAVSAGPNGDCNHGDHCEFATRSFNPTPTLSLLSETMHAYWASFICTGNPNLVPSLSSSSSHSSKEGRVEGRVEWPAYGGNEGKKILLFGEGNDELAGGRNPGTVTKVVDDEWMVKECGFWWDRTLRLD